MMKRLLLSTLILLTGTALLAQNQHIIPKIEKQMSAYFAEHPLEKIFVTTDKRGYRPGETVWISAHVFGANSSASSLKERELFIKLLNSKGESKVQGVFKLTNGPVSGDLALPKNLERGIYFLCIFTSASKSPEDISITRLTIDPAYQNQWIFDTKLKDSISTVGEKNEIYLSLKDLTGVVQKNSNLRYQISNGENVIVKGKAKSDGLGKVTIPFTLPATTNGEPFLCSLGDNREEWKDELFLPSNVDPIVLNFYPEGGSLVPGSVAKIGFTAFNKWGMAVEVEGILKNSAGQTIPAKTFAPGLGFLATEIVEGQKYTFVIHSKTGQNQSFELPVSSPGKVSLSILKSDAEFITTLLRFMNHEKHQVGLVVTHGSTICWSAETEISQSGQIRIPTGSLPQGINLLSLFSVEGELLAERIFYVDKNRQLNIAIHPENLTLKRGESTKIKVLLTDEADRPLSANLTVAVADRTCIEGLGSLQSEKQLFSSELLTPFDLISGSFKGRLTQNTLLDIFLISNRLKNFDWSGILGSNAVKTQFAKPLVTPKIAPGQGLESRLSEFIAHYVSLQPSKNRYLIPENSYYNDNKVLFPKAPKATNNNVSSFDNQRKMLESASSILDVIKSMKQYKVVNNQIVFSGSENSINYQGGALIVLDGQQLGTDISALASISPMDVDHINVSTNAMDIQKYTGLNSVGVIEIYTKRAVAPETKTIVETQERYVQGYRQPSQFKDQQNGTKIHSSTTLLWIPLQSVGESGQFEFTVKAGTIVSNFDINIQGISNDGRIGSGRASFSVAD